MVIHDQKWKEDKKISIIMVSPFSIKEVGKKEADFKRDGPSF
jgi:hypothetical protein